MVASNTSSILESMIAEVTAELAARAALHRALADPCRLAIVEALAHSDRTPGALRALTGTDWNLLGFHLRTLEDAGVIERHGSAGDRRRRYVRLRAGALDGLRPAPALPAFHRPLFVCTRNSARSPFAAGLWRARTGRPAASAGSHPAPRVHPLAVAVAAGYEVQRAGARPQGYGQVTTAPDLVVSVCDRALEGGLPVAAPHLHWSVPDPQDRPGFETAFADIAGRIDRLARTKEPG
jgi:ArsR family transcriptional regulator, arsenate/arsenite/antimonite-responsive transcriptional repressor / arsenate reductase (thioredoxin)